MLMGGIFHFKCVNAVCDQSPFEAYASVGESIPCPSCLMPAQLTQDKTINAEAPEMYSEAVGVHPSQIAEAQRQFPHHRFTPDGRMIFKGQREKDRVLKDLGYVDHKD